MTDNKDKTRKNVEEQTAVNFQTADHYSATSIIRLEYKMKNYKQTNKSIKTETYLAVESNCEQHEEEKNWPQRWDWHFWNSLRINNKS